MFLRPISKLFILFFVTLFIAICVTNRSAHAQEQGYTGISPVNSSFGGVAVASPIDGNAAIYWNPATISSLNKGEFQFGFGRNSPPWYGDESLAYSVLIPVAAVLWALHEADDSIDYFEDKYGNSSNNNSNNNTSSNKSSSSDRNRIPKIRSFNICFVAPPSRFSQWNYGIAMTETGQRKQRLVIDPTTHKIKGMQVYRVKNIEIAPALSWWNKRRLSFGFSPIFSIEEHPNASLPLSYSHRFLGDERGHVGFGMQLGVYYETKNDFNFGFSVKSPIWIPSQTYRWENTSTGAIRVRSSDFSQDSPLRMAFGVSYSGMTNGMFGIDVRYYDFQHVGSLYDFSSNRKKRTVTSIGAGAQYQICEGVALRIGYQYSDGNCNSIDDLLYNTTLPIQRGHSMHYGITLGDPDSWDITFSGSHSFGEQEIRLTNGSLVDANPNNSTFWWGLRFHF